MITTINEFKNSMNENVAKKDWDRMMNLYLSGKDGENVAKSIKDKKKAIARYVAGLKLSGSEFKPSDNGRTLWTQFSDFGERALALGATNDEIQAVYDITEVPQAIKDKMANLSSKNFDDRFVGRISKAILDAGFDINFLNRGGNALTEPGRDAMRRNGRKWTIGYKTEIVVNGEPHKLEFDAITDEGDGPTYFVTGSTDPIFRSVYTSWDGVGIRDFIKQILKALHEATVPTTTENATNERIMRNYYTIQMTFDCSTKDRNCFNHIFDHISNEIKNGGTNFKSKHDTYGYNVKKETR